MQYNVDAYVQCTMYNLYIDSKHFPLLSQCYTCVYTVSIYTRIYIPSHNHSHTHTQIHTERFHSKYANFSNRRPLHRLDRKTNVSNKIIAVHYIHSQIKAKYAYFRAVLAWMNEKCMIFYVDRKEYYRSLWIVFSVWLLCFISCCCFFFFGQFNAAQSHV